MSAILTADKIWPVTQEIRNSSKFRRVESAPYWHYALRPLLRIAQFLPTS